MHPATLTPALLAGWPGISALLAFLVLLKVLFLVSSRRQYREMRVMSALRGLNPAVYRHFSDLRLPHSDEGRSVRIPHVVVSPFGIFVIDTSHTRGLIRGTEYNATWSCRARFHSQRFPNPFLRGRVQVEALMRYLNLPDPPFHPVVVFTQPCKFESPHPDAVTTDDLIHWLRRQKVTILDSGTVARADARLTNLQDSLNRPTRTPAHALHVRQAV